MSWYHVVRSWQEIWYIQPIFDALYSIPRTTMSRPISLPESIHWKAPNREINWEEQEWQSRPVRTCMHVLANLLQPHSHHLPRYTQTPLTSCWWTDPCSQAFPSFLEHFLVSPSTSPSRSPTPYCNAYRTPWHARGVFCCCGMRWGLGCVIERRSGG